MTKSCLSAQLQMPQSHLPIVTNLEAQKINKKQAQESQQSNNGSETSISGKASTTKEELPNSNPARAWF